MLSNKKAIKKKRKIERKHALDQESDINFINSHLVCTYAKCE